MTTRNGQFRVSPQGGERGGRFFLDAETSGPIPLFVPVVATADTDGLGRREVQLATGAQAKPVAGSGGVLFAEKFHNHGLDPEISTYSDADTVAPGKPVQVITGENTVKIALRNTSVGSYTHRPGYPAGRTMVAGGPGVPTPTVAIGDYLTPGVGTDADGYWAETADATQGWLRVTGIDGEWLECVLNF